MQCSEVSRSGYYAWDNRPKSARAVENEVITEQIKDIHKKKRQTYGSKKMTAEIRRNGRVVNHKRIERLMSEAGIRRKPITGTIMSVTLLPSLTPEITQPGITTTSGTSSIK